MPSHDSIPVRGITTLPEPRSLAPMSGGARKLNNRFAPSTERAANVIIVEDEAPVRSMVSRMLTGMGCQVAAAANLVTAREMLRRGSAKLVLCDLGLPDGSGMRLLEELAPRSPEVAVVMMTGNDDTQTAIDCLRAGAFDYILKPFSLKDLHAVVVRVMDRQLSMENERRRIEEQLSVLSKFSSENPNPVLRVTTDGTLLYANAASFAFLDELRVQVGGKMPDFMRTLIDAALNQDRVAAVELQSMGRCYSLAVTPIKDADYVYVYGHDVTSLKEAEQQLTILKDQAQELALHDTLTGLPNRTLLESRFQQMVADCQRYHTSLAVVFIDLDNFKQINDTQGHKIGDQVLIAVANRLRGNLRGGDVVARWGGDEMILLLQGLNRDNARPVCERLKDNVQRQILKEDGFYLTMSMGAALYPDDATDSETLLQSADAAVLMAKNRAKNEVILFSECEDLKSFRLQTTIRSLLSRAVAERRIQVHFQPVVETVSGRTVGMEALARWHEEGHGWVPPNMFIPLAENMGLIEDLGRQVMEQALAQLARCHAEGFAISMAVNVSLRQLLRSDYPRTILEMTHAAGMLPEHVTLELTESKALLGINTETRRLEELSMDGFRLAIDDFGQGYSSLASLYEMQVEELKIDMKFVRNLHTPKGRQIVQTIKELCRTLELETVAEGVETEEQLRILTELGIDKLQGYYFSKPLSAEDFVEFLRVHHRDGISAARAVPKSASVSLPS